ncbi:60S acidic ribosomal protein P0 [Amphibalanus amphitrite]|uniref:60S acidic ribosomal protein P0 n=1 Tax=Amphibalanus amphitrite TaxID=1232801 RepID=A0A6A4W9Z0_AMPAM|nr:60S acidic ribosomal protein P0 [Amphibalanus amphitrite]
MVREDRRKWKENYFSKLSACLDEYPKCFIVGADNVGSKQMQQIRIALRGTATVVMGKNTMMRKVIRGKLDSNPHLEKLLPHIVENVGFVFTKEDLSEVREKLLSNKNTGLGPEKTSFFQALSIATKISKGTIEIINDVNLINEGDKVGNSEATLLNMLGISPFSYGLVVKKVYDSGTVFDPKVLDLTDDDLIAAFVKGVRNVAAVSLTIGVPTAASVPHSIINGFKDLLAIAAETDITFKEAEKVKEYLADPSKFAVAAAPVAAETKEAAAPAKVEEPEESEDDDMGFGLFD